MLHATLLAAFGLLVSPPTHLATRSSCRRHLRISMNSEQRQQPAIDVGSVADMLGDIPKTPRSGMEVCDSYDSFEMAVADSAKYDILTIVEYTQPRCMACRAMSMKLDTLAKNHDIRVLNVDVVRESGRAITATTGKATEFPRLDIYKMGERVYSGVFLAKDWRALMASLVSFGGPPSLMEE